MRGEENLPGARERARRFWEAENGKRTSRCGMDSQKVGFLGKDFATQIWLRGKVHGTADDRYSRRKGKHGQSSKTENMDLSLGSMGCDAG